MICSVLVATTFSKSAAECSRLITDSPRLIDKTQKTCKRNNFLQDKGALYVVHYCIGLNIVFASIVASANVLSLIKVEKSSLSN